MGCGASSSAQNVTSPDGKSSLVTPVKVSSNAFGIPGVSKKEKGVAVDDRPPPPAILLSDPIPHEIKTVTCPARPAGEPPYERLALISSRVADRDKFVGTTLPRVAYVAYDWKNSTPEQLLQSIQTAIGDVKVASIAVLDPTDQPGSLQVLKGIPASSSTDAVDPKAGELWKALAGLLDAVVEHEGTRVDLLGCGVMAQAGGSAAMMKALHEASGVRFAASDDSSHLYRLSTYLNNSRSGKLNVVHSGIKGLELYFNVPLLQGAGQEAFGTAAAPAPSGQETASDVAGPSLDPAAATVGGLAGGTTAATVGGLAGETSSQNTAADAAKVASGASQDPAGAAGGAAPAASTVPETASDAAKVASGAPFGNQAATAGEEGRAAVAASSDREATAIVANVASGAPPGSSSAPGEAGSVGGAPGSGPGGQGISGEEEVRKVASAGIEGGTPAAPAPAAQEVAKDLAAGAGGGSASFSNIPGVEEVQKVASAGMEGGTPAATAAAQDVAKDLAAGAGGGSPSPSTIPGVEDVQKGTSALPPMLPPMGSVKG